MRRYLADLVVEDISATPSLPSDFLAASNVLKVRRKDGRVPDSCTIVMEFPSGNGSNVPGLLYKYSAKLAGWIPSRYMLFGDDAACLADTTGATSGSFQVFLDSDTTHLFFLPDFDNIGGAAGDATDVDYALILDEHEEYA